ncbi:polymorphic toxin type 27 domain-containing protein [Streptomyces bluensis]|uniref:polymorphic toxin type 27 domain-containing protein n=1 Tax=Streptomyces bluensis TaxID=33897 RepID=UPI00332D7A7E
MTTRGRVRKNGAAKARDKARELRDDAWDAKQKADAKRAKADAKEAYAQAHESDSNAQESRAAADEADKHADDAEAAAGRARSAADAATQAAAEAKTAVELADEAEKHAKTAKSQADEANKEAAKALAASAKGAGFAHVTAQATEDAAAADKAAGRAEGYAKDARASADQAALDATAAHAAADEAEQAAKDARAAAERADAAATEAEEAAKDAQKYAESAQEAATQAENAGNAKQIETGTVPDGAGGLIGGVFYVVDHIEQVGEPKVLKKTDGCDGWWDQLAYDGDCTMTTRIGYKADLDLYLCRTEVWENSCFSGDTLYLGPQKTDTLYTEVTHTITIAEYQQGVDPIDILFGSWIRCAQKLTPGGENGSWGGCAWAVVDVASLFAGKIVRPIADAVRALDGAARTGIGFIDAWAALRSLRISEVAVAGIASKIMQAVYKACESAASRARPAASARAFAAQSSNEECIRQVLKDLVKDGDHVVLGINPYADDLAKSIGAKTFNNGAYGTNLPREMGMGERPIWTVGVERTVSNPNVRLTVSLDGVAGAANADDALKLLLQWGESINGSDWELIRSSGYGTAWEMIKLRTAVRLGDRSWSSIEWRMGGKVVHPERFKLANGEPVP